MRTSRPAPRTPRPGSPPVRWNERDGSLRTELEEVRARVAVHVAADRETQKIQNRGRDVHDGSALVAPGRDRRAEGQHETVRRAVVRAAQIRLAQQPGDRVLHRIDRLHAESRYDQEQIPGRETIEGGANLAVDVTVIPIERRTEPLAVLLGYGAKRSRLRIP